MKGIRKEISFYLIAIILLSISLSFMHINLVMYGKSKEIYKTQLAIVNGRFTFSPDTQARLLFPRMVKVIGMIIPQKLLPHVYHSSLSLAAAEWISIFFCLFGLFLLSNEIFRSRLKSFMVVIIYSIYLPYIFSVSHRFGEAFIPGFFSFLFYSVLARRHILYVVLLILCSFQRVDIAFTSIFFKIIYEYFFLNKKHKALLVDVLLFIIPVAIIGSIMHFYKMHDAARSELLRLFSLAAPANTILIPFVFFYYLPIFVLAIFRFKKFDKRVYCILYSLLPYLFFIYCFGGFRESRLLHPLVITLLIGSLSSIKDSYIRNFVTLELESEYE